MNLPEMLPKEDRGWAYDTFKKWGGELAFSLWAEMVQIAGVEKAFSNILESYEDRGLVLNDEFKQVMFTALMHHLDIQKVNN